MSSRLGGMSTSQPTDDSVIPLIHDADLVQGSSFPGLDDAPTQVRPHSSLAQMTGQLGTAEPVASAQILGARLDHFELLDSIGVGGMGRVFRARDTRLDRLVALKVLSPELSTDPEICRRFEQEAKAAARLDDRHFARVYFFGFDKGLRYIAMEYVEGENIRQKINKAGRLPLSQVINVAIQIAQGLTHAASCGVVHRDIKPSNIILTPDGTAKLVDMGLARNFYQQSSPASELTQAGVTLGTFDYISPEQALDPRDADVRSDIYSLGCTLYHSITGQPPFNKGSALQKILQHQNDAVPDPRRWVADLPEDMVLVLMRMLAKDPKERYQHPVELIEDLRAIAFTQEIPLPEEPLHRPAARLAPTFWENHLTWMLPLGVLLAALFGYAWLDRPSPPASRPIDLSPTDQATPTNLSRRENGPSEIRPMTAPTTTPQRPKVVVPADGDLATALRQALPGTEIKLAGKRYVLSDAGEGAGIRSIIIEKELRIEPELPTGLTEIEVRTGTWSGRAGGDGSSLVKVRSESVEMRRLAWIVKSAGDSSIARSLFSVAGGRLLMEDCFIRVAGGSREEPISIIQLEGSEGRRLGSLVLRRCLLHGADEAIRVLSPTNTEIELVDCAVDHSLRTPFRLEGLGDVALTMEHVTVRGLQAPLFKIQRLGGARIQTRGCVFSHVAKTNGAEVSFVDFQSDGTWTNMTDSWWSGRGNLFHLFHPMTISRGGQAIVRSLKQARPLGFDETVLVSVDRPEEIFVTAEDVPLPLSVESGPMLADRLRLRSTYVEREEGPFGWRQTPWGSAYGSKPAVEPRASESVTSDVAPKPATLVGPIMVDPTAKEGAEPNVFVSLAQAIEQAPTSATIDVRVDGLVEVSPVSCRGKSIVIRSAAGYTPILYWDATRPGSRTDASLFEMDSPSKLTLEGLAMIVRTDGEKSVGVALMDSGAEFSLRDTSVQIDGNLMKSKALLIKEGMSSNGLGPKSCRIHLHRSTLRTSGSLMTTSSSMAAEIDLIDAFVVSARSLITLDGLAEEHRLSLQIERSTILLGESLLTGPSFVTTTESSANNRLSTRDSILLGYGSSPLFVTNSLAESSSLLPSFWSSERTFVAGFAAAGTESAGGGPLAPNMLTFDELQKNRESFQGIIFVGKPDPFVLGAGGIKTAQVPLLLNLRKLGYPSDGASLLGVPAQVLPPEPTPSSQR
ncbi:serine/threonine protein kinase [bacterium]|nr:serine/threonine protein kinase [bacterium]